MKTLSKFWNFKLLGIPKACFVLMCALMNTLYDKINTYFWSKNIYCFGKNSSIQKGVVIRYPKNISIGNNVNIGRNTRLISESSAGKLVIGDNVRINRNCLIDFTGNLIISSGCTISENVMIETHTHGLNPRSSAVGLSKLIDVNVWIGAKAIILPQVSLICKYSIIGAGSIVSKDVPEYTIVGGSPARRIGTNNI